MKLRRIIRLLPFLAMALLLTCTALAAGGPEAAGNITESGLTLEVESPRAYSRVNIILASHTAGGQLRESRVSAVSLNSGGNTFSFTDIKKDVEYAAYLTDENYVPLCPAIAFYK